MFWHHGLVPTKAASKATTPKSAATATKSTAVRQTATPPPTSRDSHTWTLLTSHGRVLLLVARDPELKVREIAERAQITERAASGITADLAAAGYLTKVRDGRRTTYVVHPEAGFRHPAEAHHRIGELIDVFTQES